MRPLLLAALALLLLPTPTQAQEDGPNWRSIRQRQWVCRDWSQGCGYEWRWRRVRVYPNHVYRLPEHEGPSRVYGYERREVEVERRHCPHPMLRQVGNQHLTVDGAKKAADDAWAGDVRFRHGEVFMDLNNARDVTYTCSRSSIKEGGVTTLGQSLTRCEIRGTPCKAPRSQPLPPPEDRDER